METFQQKLKGISFSVKHFLPPLAHGNQLKTMENVNQYILLLKKQKQNTYTSPPFFCFLPLIPKRCNIMFFLLMLGNTCKYCLES